MKPIMTSATTHTLGAPKDWDAKKNGPCIGLPVHVSDDPFVYSWWKLTWRERFQVLLGHPIQLCIVGRTHAPVSLLVASNHPVDLRDVARGE